MLGYPSLLVLITYIVYVVPEIRRLNALMHDGGFEFAMASAVPFYYYYALQIILILILALMFFIELFLKHKGKTFNFDIQKKTIIFQKIHKFFFWCGIFFVFIPIYFLILLFIISPLISFIFDFLR